MAIFIQSPSACVHQVVGVVAGHLPLHRLSLLDKVRACFTSFRQHGWPAKDLIAGPYAGEFGYELMQWQGYVRARHHYYREVHVITYPGRGYLYEGCVVHHHDIPLHKAGYQYGALGPGAEQGMAAEKAREIGLADYDVFSPALLCTKYHRRLFKQDFRLFQEPAPDLHVHEVAFHFRAVEKAGDHAKNYPREFADKLVEMCRARGWSPVCIGHPDYSMCVQGCQDRRHVELRETVAAICGARIVAGANSGPMHLANLCGKPTLIWAFAQRSIDYSLRWNPFRVPIFVAANDSHAPEPKRVAEALAGAMEQLRHTTSDFTKPAYRLPAVRIPCY